MNPFIFLIAGVVGLYFGADYVVESAKEISERLNISQTLVGLTIISIGTSLPEIMTNLSSGLKVRLGIEASGIAVGTNLGSDIVQITLILGCVILFGALSSTKKLMKKDGMMVLLSIIAVFIVGLTGSKITLAEGIILLLAYFIYLHSRGMHEKVIGKVRDEIKNFRIESFRAYLKDGILMALGIGILILASDIVVRSALIIAEIWGVAQSFIGVMVIGVGTALPELSTALRALFKKAGDISIGTLIGSNITDPMFSMAVGAIATGSAGLSFDKSLLFFDVPFWFIASIIALLLISFRTEPKEGKTASRRGLVLIGLYIIFMVLKFRFFMY
ncbi:sodium:calcium antiporter [Candidatus Woesearchaeota archaeon]|nr:sodium:calcium antiporter [Candidatus Woesearchaeota archaeon]